MLLPTLATAPAQYCVVEFHGAAQLPPLVGVGVGLGVGVAVGLGVGFGVGVGLGIGVGVGVGVGAGVGVGVGAGVGVGVGVGVGEPLGAGPTNCQRAGTLGGSQPTWDVWAWMHLYSLPLKITSAPAA